MHFNVLQETNVSTTQALTAQVRSETQSKPHPLIRITTPDVQKKLIDYLKIKELTCLMVTNRAFLQHFRTVFNDLGKENQIWQSVFHQRIAREAPWTELRHIDTQRRQTNTTLPIHLIQNWGVAIQSIITKSRPLFNEVQSNSLTTLLSNCKYQQDFNYIEVALRVITVRCSQAQAQQMSKEYHSLVEKLSFVNATEFNRSATALNDLYPYRALIKRRVGDQRLKKAITFTPSREILKNIRTKNSLAWQHLLQARSGISATVLRESCAFPNWLRAEALVATRAEQRQPITIEWLGEIHGVLSKGLHNNGHPAGCCRPPNVQMFASESNRYYVDGKYVRDEMAAFLAWFNNRLSLHDSETAKPQHQWHLPWIILTAAQASQWMVSIHPFGDGNGRASRLVMDYVLQRYGILPPQLSRWIAPVWGDNRQNVDEAHAINLVWDGIEESYRRLGLK